MSFLEVDYASYIQSEAWWARKKEYYEKHAKRCSACCSKKQIHLHHMTYERLGRELDSDMVPLCERCHDEVHRLKAENSFQPLTRVTLDYIALRSRKSAALRRAERRDAAAGIGLRKPGERRQRQFGPVAPKRDSPTDGMSKKEKKEFFRAAKKERRRLEVEAIMAHNAQVMANREFGRQAAGGC